jgi:hypothetical protein
LAASPQHGKDPAAEPHEAMGDGARSVVKRSPDTTRPTLVQPDGLYTSLRTTAAAPTDCSWRRYSTGVPREAREVGPSPPEWPLMRAEGY